MKFISSSDKLENIDQKETIDIFINKLGRPVQENSELIFGQISTTGSQSKYAILVFNNQPYDPYGIDSHRESKLTLKLKQVSQETYNHYLSYLKTKNSLYMTRAQRSFING